VKAAAQGKRKPGKISPATSRSIYPRPPLRDSTQVMSDSKSKAKPPEGTPQSPVDRGFAADYSGASPVASALNLPRERDSPKNRNQTITHSPPARSKPDISTLQGIGHFYFALTWARERPTNRHCGSPPLTYRHRRNILKALLIPCGGLSLGRRPASRPHCRTQSSEARCGQR
jgi:hypothetical protein